ncbi:hypothetical protein LTR36_008408 [Oleoguttula mirabilis]|uniref:Glutaminase n=1 Tax=Oleoguttula mirabilis TaxID=1507867 RepID=A0AAV9J881_9PEZI|nr:hypothetical protein LTR36_008408 [Oleoguttula mirabilis]
MHGPALLGLFGLFALSTRSGASTVSLPSYPLAVKNPYLSTWVPGSSLADAATAQPEFWAGQDITWTVLARVNGVTYSLFGNPQDTTDTSPATTTGISFTSSHTLVDLTAGAASFTLDFFSPVLPGTSDYARQSLPYSYLTVTANATSSQSVQVLSAIDQTWTAQNGAADLNYTTLDTEGYFQFYNPDQYPFTESSDQATWGSIVFATTTGSEVTPGCDTAATIYEQFATNGSLAGVTSCYGSDLAAWSKDLGSVSEDVSESVTFAVGLDRQLTINYLGVTQTGYYRTQWPTIETAVSYFLQNYSLALSDSNTFDDEVRSRSESVSSVFGSQYADINEASVRQSFGAIELTVPKNDLTATPQVFLKEISSDGNINTVDVIFQSWPIFISLNPYYIRYLLQPIISYLESGDFPQAYVLHDLGANYPNATGHNDGSEESMPLFETSSLFILLYAYQKFTGDTTWAQQYLSLLQEYGEYLIANSLYPSSQLISVDAITAYANQTALAIQSTIGLKAAALVTGNATFSTVADTFATKIYTDALGLDGATLAESTHFTYYYGEDTTWNVLFASFSDVLLELDTFPTAAWELQSDWYATQLQELGLPFAGPVTDLDYTGSAITWGLSDWNIVAAGASSTAVQESVINTTHAFLTNGLNVIPFGTKYNVEGDDVGVWIGNKARGTVGSDFALLALDQGTWGTSY